MVDMLVLETSGVTPVQVQVLCGAPTGPYLERASSRLTPERREIVWQPNPKGMVVKHEEHGRNGSVSLLYSD